MRRVCLLRISAIGDAVHALAVVRAIQHAEPDTALTWVIGGFERRLMEGISGVRLVTFDKGAGLAGYRRLQRELGREPFDVLLHQQVALRANLASLMIKAVQRIGYDRQRARDGHGLFINQRIAADSGQHVQDALLSFLAPAGITPLAAPTWDLPISDDDLAFAREHIDATRPTLTLCPVSSHALRNWRPERYAAAADHAAERHDMQVIIAGGPSDFEQNFNSDIETSMRQPVLNLTGKDTLKQLAGLLKLSQLVLAPDTGPMHIANAVGTPVLGLHAASNPRRSGPYSSLDWCVDRYDAAARKYLGKPAAQLRWGQKIERPGVMDLIEVSDVTERLDAFAAQLPRQ
ncbi:MAG: glycosyltransferase family 9 protein [Pseudomonadota bacterium]